MRYLPLLVLVAACGSPPPAHNAAGSSKPAVAKEEAFLELEQVSGDKALAFARAHNEVSEKTLTADPGFKPLEERLFSIFSSKERIPHPSIEHDSLRNFWTDAEHPRGLWRQTTFADYKKAKPTWTTLLDVDALGREDKESYVWHGAQCLYPLRKRCLVKLSKGGGDAIVVREFDVEKKAFVKDGFVLPEAKSNVGWKDADTIYVGTDFGPGSLTKSGYPRLAKEWKRGTPLSAAKTIFEVKEDDIAGGCDREFDEDRVRDFCYREIDFEHNELHVMRDGKLVKVEKPEDAEAGVAHEEIVIRLRSDWQKYKKGSLLTTNLEAFIKGDREMQVLFEPTKNSALDGWAATKTRLLINVLEDVKNKVTVFARKPGDKRWTGTPLAETASSIGFGPFDSNRSDDVWLWLEDFTLPASLALFDPTTGKRETIKQNPSFYDANGIEVKQHFATSKDGTKVPYFEVGKKDRGGPAPALLEAYGGFEVSLNAFYASSIGAAWIERGGVYVQANLRGGGEYGPAWHEAAMKHDRQHAYDDMAAVAEDLVKRGVTTSKLLGITGASNGGLLTSVMLTQRPELFGAVVSQVPLTDMQRYHKLLAGASWMSEYGDPDKPEDWAALSKFSPFQNAKKGTYPPTFFTTSTKDDRVHPGHARRMVAKLESLGHKPLYYENIEGGHGGAADIKQRAYVDALVYTFLATKLGLK
jgi:prolyl oligopeptidase